MLQKNQGVKPFSISLHSKYKKRFGVQKKLNFFDVLTSYLKTIIIQVYQSYFLQLFVVTFTNFLTKGIFIKISVTILDCSTFQLYFTSHLEWPVFTNMVYRDQQLAYVAYAHTPNFGHVYVEMNVHFFPCDFSMIYCFKLLQIWPFICLSFQDTGSLLFIFILTKACFSISYTNYLINISSYRGTLANLGCQ